MNVKKTGHFKSEVNPYLKGPLLFDNSFWCYKLGQILLNNYKIGDDSTKHLCFKSF